MIVVTPSMVTATSIGNSPSGTFAATKVLVLTSNVSQAGNGPPLGSATRIGAPAGVCAVTWIGKEKLNPFLELTTSRGTETAMLPLL